VKAYNAEKQQRYVDRKKEEIGEDNYKKQKSEYMRAYRAGHTEVHTPHIEHVPELSKKYIAGFNDGDGSIHSKLALNGDVSLTYLYFSMQPIPFAVHSKEIRWRYAEGRQPETKTNAYFTILNLPVAMLKFFLKTSKIMLLWNTNTS